MALIDEVRDVCQRIGPFGWRNLLKEKHGLDIEAADLAAELGRELPGIHRATPGFQDFAKEGKRGIEPGQPARSLLYHALAAPNVLTDDRGHRLGTFPTAAEIETVENYVFAAQPATLDDLRARAGGAALSVVVFAYEYRPGAHTCHKKHADLVFSRTGVARVGTAPPLYDAERRGFLPVKDDDPFALRVLPSRYAAFLAVQMPGNASGFLPMRFQVRGRPDGKSDTERTFWVPIHKLFAGSECLAGLGDLTVSLTPHHVNEKLRRIHLALGKLTVGGVPFDAGVAPELLDSPPFHFQEGIADFTTDPTHARGTLVPTVHAHLVARAELDGKAVTFNVPPNPDLLATSLSMGGANVGGERVLHAPEYVHIRTQVRPNGSEVDLNTRNTLRTLVGSGGYKAIHYLDFTGDGWIDVACPQVTAPGLEIGAPVAAYSLVTPPDFFPSCDQRSLTEWTENLPNSFKDLIWETPPDALSDQRFAPNLQLKGGPFQKTDTTATALLSLFGEVSPERTEPPLSDVLRHSHLPDDSAGVFAPGWDVSIDGMSDGSLHLATYGLGSPFPEDAKLCAALSTFWPAAAPDATRTFEFGPLSNRYFTVSPLTDEEIGQVGSLPWDGIAGPRVVQSGGQQFVEYTSIDYADYVLNALQDKFSQRVTSHIDKKSYQDRVLSMALAYQVLGVVELPDKLNWIVLSFRAVTPGDAESQAAQLQAGLTLLGNAYRFEVFRNPRTTVRGSSFRKIRMRIDDRRTLFVDPENRRVLMKAGSSPWQGQTLAIP